MGHEKRKTIRNFDRTVDTFQVYYLSAVRKFWDIGTRPSIYNERINVKNKCKSEKEKKVVLAFQSLRDRHNISFKTAVHV